jgi:7,8-dihydropterin-6-yl-methyl-4-(beta-D-ribofuranosyl)aminobenzene 5'-phosphate synthase
MRAIILQILAALSVFLPVSVAGARDMTIRIVYNNVAYDAELSSAWGMACVIEGFEKTILFDTGGDGAILLSNMEKMGINPEEVDIVVLSHIHGDHTGGLRSFLQRNPDVTVYLPASFPSSFKDGVRRLGAIIVEISEEVEIIENVYSTGELGTGIREQALVVCSKQGLIIITGCAHPGIVTTVEKAVQMLDRRIYLVTGGFHLGGVSGTEMHSIIRELQELGVEKIAPSHCTGERAMRCMRNAWGTDFLECGCGSFFSLPLSKPTASK